MSNENVPLWRIDKRLRNYFGGGQSTALNEQFMQEYVLEAGTANTRRGVDEKGILTYNVRNMVDYFRLYDENDLIRSYVDDIAEQAVGLGYYTTVEKLTPKLQKSASKEYIDAFLSSIGADDLFPNILKIAYIAGFCPVESKFTKGDPEDQSLKIIHPLTIVPNEGISVDPKNMSIIRIKQKVGTAENIIKAPDITTFTYNQIGNSPLGSSGVKPVVDLVNQLTKTTVDIMAILDRYIAPVGIWKTKGKIDNLKLAVTERASGEDIFLGNLTDEEFTSKDNPYFIKVEGNPYAMPFIDYLDKRIYASFRGSSTWYSRNATQASAKIMDDIVQRHISSIQRSVKRTVELNWFGRLADLNNLPEAPRINFGEEPTGVKDVDISTMLTTGLQLGYIDQDMYHEIMQSLGIKMKQFSEEEAEAGSEADKTAATGDNVEQVANRQYLYNVVYDVLALCRFHAIANTVKSGWIKNLVYKYARIYGQLDQQESFIAKITSQLEAEGYKIEGDDESTIPA